MTKNEFIQEFHTLWNSINSDMAPGITYAELGHFATQAQETLVRAIYNGTLGEPFESTEEARSYLDNLVRQCELPKMGTTVSSVTIPSDPNKIDSSSISYWLTDNVSGDSKIMYIVYEAVTFNNNAGTCYKGKTALVKPVTHDMYFRIKDNPFKGANEERVLRLTKSAVISNKTYDIAEIISKDLNIGSYIVRYIKRPDDIVFDNTSLSDELCELHSNLHRLILSSTVSLAKATWNS